MAWEVARGAPALNPDEAHVWRVSLECDRGHVEWLSSLLAREERERADRFHFPRDQRRFIIARGRLRLLLARYLARPPAELRFCYGAAGKPALEPVHAGPDLRFNVSHSGDLALIAVGRGRELGVDLEQIRPRSAYREIASVSFSPREAAALRSLPPELQQEAFLTCWVRKEAYVKARGAGIRFDPAAFDVSLIPAEPRALLRCDSSAVAPDRWTIHELNPGRNYVGALAAERQVERIRCFKWTAGDVASRD